MFKAENMIIGSGGEEYAVGSGGEECGFDDSDKKAGEAPRSVLLNYANSFSDELKRNIVEFEERIKDALEVTIL